MERAPDTSGKSENFISENHRDLLGPKTQSKTDMDLHLRGLEAGDNVTKSESCNLDGQKQPAMPCDQNHLEVERMAKKRCREGAGEKEEVREEKLEKKEEKEEEEKEKKNKEQYPEERFVSKPLMDTLWAMFKFKKFPAYRDIASLAFEFSMTEIQINKWFHKKRRKYNKELHKRTYKKKQKRC